MASGFLHDIADRRLTAEQVADAIASTGLLPLTASGGIELHANGKGGTSIAAGQRTGLRVTDIRLAAVTNQGPKNQSDFNDERYWTIAGELSAGSVDARLDAQADAGNYPSDW